MFLALTSAGLLYAACVALFHAHPKRTRVELVRSHEQGPLVVRAGASVLILATTMIVASPLGWERAIPIVLGVLAAAGVLCVLAAVYTPRRHLLGGAVSLAVGVVSGAAAILGQ